MTYYQLFHTNDSVDDIEVFESIRVAIDNDGISALDLLIDDTKIASFLMPDNRKYKEMIAKLNDSSLECVNNMYYIPKGAIVKLYKEKSYVVIKWKEIEVKIFDDGLDAFFSSSFK